MLREFICIMCPQGCEITAETTEGRELSVAGNLCPKGRDYATQEIVNPMRNIASSIQVEGGELPLASVRLTKLVPKSSVFQVMEEIKKIKLTAPVYEGTTVIEHVLGLESDVIVTKTVLPCEGN